MESKTKNTKNTLIKKEEYISNLNIEKEFDAEYCLENLILLHNKKLVSLKNDEETGEAKLQILNSETLEPEAELILETQFKILKDVQYDLTFTNLTLLSNSKTIFDDSMNNLYIYSLPDEKNKEFKLIKKLLKIFQQPQPNSTVFINGIEEINTKIYTKSFLVYTNNLIKIYDQDTFELKKEIKNFSTILNIYILSDYICILDSSTLKFISKNNSLDEIEKIINIDDQKHCFISEIIDDNKNKLFIGIENKIKILNLDNFEYEKEIIGKKRFNGEENDHDDDGEELEIKEENKKYYGYGEWITGLRQLKNGCFVLISNEWDEGGVDTGVLCLLDKDFNVLKEFRIYVGTFDDILMLENDKFLIIGSKTILCNA